MCSVIKPWCVGLLALLLLSACGRKLSRSVSRQEAVATAAHKYDRTTMLTELATDTIRIPEMQLTGVFNLNDTAEQTITSGDQQLLVTVKAGKAKVVATVKPKAIPFAITRTTITHENTTATTSTATVHRQAAKDVRSGWSPPLAVVVTVIICLMIFGYLLWRRLRLW